MEHVHKSASHAPAAKIAQSMQQGTISAETFQFKDDRPEVSRQRNIQSLADHAVMSRFSMQLKKNVHYSGSPIQTKASPVSNTGNLGIAVQLTNNTEMNSNRIVQRKSLEELVNESPLAEKAAKFEEDEKNSKGPVQLKKNTDTSDMQQQIIQRRRVSDGVVIGSINSTDYPESVQHISDAITAGQPSRVTTHRPGARSNRRDSLRGIPTMSGTDRDEYPMAMLAEGGTGASVRHIDPSDNRGAGSSMGHILRSGAPDGTVVDVEIVPQSNGSTVVQL